MYLKPLKHGTINNAWPTGLPAKHFACCLSRMAYSGSATLYPLGTTVYSAGISGCQGWQAASNHPPWCQAQFRLIPQALLKGIPYLALTVLPTSYSDPSADPWHLPRPCPRSVPRHTLAHSYHSAFAHNLPPPCSAGPALPLSNSHPAFLAPLKPHLL